MKQSSIHHSNESKELIRQLFDIRNKFGPDHCLVKLDLLKKLCDADITPKDDFVTYYDVLLFLMAFPDNKVVYAAAVSGLQKLDGFIRSNEHTQAKLFNTGVTGSVACAEFSFEMVRWLRARYGQDVYIDSMMADEGKITSALSVAMREVESEVLQDGNA